MEIRIRRRLTGRELKRKILNTFPDRARVEASAAAGDVTAQDALFNLRLFDEDPSRLDEDMLLEDIIVLEQNDLSKLTETRLHLLEVLRRLGETSLLDLTRAVGRDRKNVSQDIGFLESYGLVEAHRHGKHKMLSAAGNEIVVSV